MASPSVLIVGSANVDFTMSVPVLPRPGETVLNGRFALNHGGKGANTAVAAARCADPGTAVAFAARLGDDALAEGVRQSLAAEGLGLSHTRTVPGHATGTAIILIDRAGENSIAVASGANANWTDQDLANLEPSIAAASLVMLQMEIPPAANMKVLDLASTHGVPVLLNVAPADPGDLALARRATVLVVNEHEARSLTGETDVTRAADVLREHGPQTVIITLGGEGALLHDTGGVRRFPARRVTVVDTTAAGDTFCGVLGVSLAQGRPIDDAMQSALNAASLCCTRAGAQPSIPRRAEVANS